MVADLKICFVVDHHAPMDPFIGALKDQFEDIINDVLIQYPMKEIQIAFISYGGYLCIPYRVVHSFTNNVKLLQKYVRHSKKKICLNCDCRNVQMAYGHVNDENWVAVKKIIFHMGNGPAFGPKYHDSDLVDAFPIGHPYLVLEEEVVKFARKNIDLVLLKLDRNWDIMETVIEESYLDFRKKGFYKIDLTDKHNILQKTVFDEVKKHILRQFV